MFWIFRLESEKINTFRGQTLMMQHKPYSIERSKAYRSTETTTMCITSNWKTNYSNLCSCQWILQSNATRQNFSILESHSKLYKTRITTISFRCVCIYMRVCMGIMVIIK